MSEIEYTPPDLTEAEQIRKDSAFIGELKTTLNRACAENGSNTPDWILAMYLLDCLDAFDWATKLRDNWYGRK